MSEIKNPDGLVFVGDLDVIPSVVSCLFGDEYAKVDTVKVSPILSLHSSWFEWGDKGCFRAWGCDAKGKVVCGIKTFGEFDYRTRKYNNMRIVVQKMNACYDWNE